VQAFRVSLCRSVCTKTRDPEVCGIFAGGVAHVAIVGKISQKSAPYSKYSRKCLRTEF